MDKINYELDILNELPVDFLQNLAVVNGVSFVCEDGRIVRVEDNATNKVLQ